ncbi:helix-turn-helix domain-containing protein [Aliicoccus persicus]|uniref:DNA-binding transcriptional regulator, XRE-family HTH domain n=1 Tax=Aliicoccus persicus TaxID=930138 RepID=A0A662Z2H4_9STAP|nr:helix-turn-helix transcriptional regulator [Aliicoccus persicus]SEV93864.1 DNA-binding transcriptional regulator, XRE-family HTH domain [Aliicoccus persicus]
MSLGNRIKSLRKQKKMTQSELIDGYLTKGTLSLIENDKTLPSIETLQKIANKLGVSVFYLTQEGDEAWTEEMAEHFKDYFLKFPYDEIEEKILPNKDRIFTNDKGLFLLSMLRYYYRLNQQHVEADNLHQTIYKRLIENGLRHLAMRELIDHASSKLYSLEYEDALRTLQQHKEEILSFKQHDSKIELSYLYIESILASAVENHALFVESSERIEALSFETLQFQHYLDAIRIMALYYTYVDEDDKKLEYVSKVKKFLEFSPDPVREIEFRYEDTLYSKYSLIEQPDDIVEKLLAYKERSMDTIDTFVSNDTGKVEYLKLTLKSLDLEIEYLQGNYEFVLEHFDRSLYTFKIALHPIDRIDLKVRTLVYALSLYKVGRIEEAKQEIMIVENDLGPLMNSIYAVEIRKIKEMIYS